MIPLKDNVVLRRPAVATLALVGLNALAFVWQVSSGAPGEPVALRIQWSALVGGAIPYEIATWRDIGPRDLVPPPFTILTSMFLHGGVLHLAGNMLFLWVFGPAVEDAIGRARFVGFYLASGVAAAIAQTLLSFAAGDPFIPMVGASGAIAGVLAAYVVLFPWARVLTVVPIFVFIRFMHLPAGFFIGLWFVLQVVNAVLGGGGSGVAFFAHVGGFVFGWLVTKVLASRR
ncbi:MAG TPA: rhomboid family intramembrane serine protease [Anaeromyxobacteraceae bacterium]|nr:rhomboid family intramembrane serine protease [Anaeromyxobacteraceae bacterium]